VETPAAMPYNQAAWRLGASLGAELRACSPGTQGVAARAPRGRSGSIPPSVGKSSAPKRRRWRSASTSNFSPRRRVSSEEAPEPSAAKGPRSHRHGGAGHEAGSAWASTRSCSSRGHSPHSGQGSSPRGTEVAVEEQPAVNQTAGSSQALVLKLARQLQSAMEGSAGLSCRLAEALPHELRVLLEKVPCDDLRALLQEAAAGPCSGAAEPRSHMALRPTMPSPPGQAAGPPFGQAIDVLPLPAPEGLPPLPPPPTPSPTPPKPGRRSKVARQQALEAAAVEEAEARSRGLQLPAVTARRQCPYQALRTQKPSWSRSRARLERRGSL